MRTRASAPRAAVLAALLLCAAAPAPAADWDVKASLEAGHDSNPFLDSEKTSDGFASQTVDVAGRCPLAEALTAVASYGLDNTTYFEATDASFLYQDAAAGLEWRADAQTSLRGRYRFSYLWYPDNEDGDAAEHSAETLLVRRLGPYWSAAAGQDISWRDYTERKARLGSAALSSEEREDLRLDTHAALVWHPCRFADLIASYRFRKNDSNDEFQDFYDYDAHRGRLGAALRPFDRLTASGSFSYEFRDYDERTLLRDASAGEEADIWTAGVGLRYACTRNASLGYRWLWRRRESNEPTQDYAEIVHTAGIFLDY